MNEVRIGVVGVGGMGSFHASNLLQGKVRRARLAAVCDLVPSKMDRYGDDVAKFEDSAKLIRSGLVDAVLVATPHYFHTTIGIDAMRNGLHLLSEKPISVHKADCERLIAAHKDKSKLFAAMFNQRTDPHYIKVRQLIQDGELGGLLRVNWIITNWFRTQAYYDSGTWRATWKGEGGGVLLNQCPHQLDLLQWLCGMPVRMRAFCNIGKRHVIEVEDEVTAYFEYANGATGVFVTTTGEAPGTNRLEIAGTRGKVVIEDGAIRFTRNLVPCDEFLRTCQKGFDQPEVWHIDIPADGDGGQHVAVLQNFVDAILDGVPLIAPGEEGIRSVELANSMLYSSLTGETVDLPLDSAAFEACLTQLIRNSNFQKAEATGVEADLSGTFNTQGK
ncbi:MAG: Gfo/Idh/MocA family protein [Kiritimatiellia bacterium]|jgi:predicted dehydrogenase